MGQPKKQRSKYSGPSHPWQKARLDEEKIIRLAYGTKNKKEIWKMKAVIAQLATQAKKVEGRLDKQAELEKTQLLQRAKKLGLIKEGQTADDILGLTLKDIMERRLQTIVFKRGLAMTIKQARQMITHEHIFVDGRKITAPSYVVPVHEEDKISYSHDSPFTNTGHPERVKYEEKVKPQQQQNAPKAEKVEAVPAPEPKVEGLKVVE